MTAHCAWSAPRSGSSRFSGSPGSPRFSRSTARSTRPSPRRTDPPHLVPTVTVSFTPLPAHVRTARFIAASVARRAGVAEGILDEIRLAVSEACSLAVRLHLAHAPDVPVELRLTESNHDFSVQVLDAVARPAPVD